MKERQYGKTVDIQKTVTTQVEQLNTTDKNYGLLKFLCVAYACSCKKLKIAVSTYVVET